MDEKWYVWQAIDEHPTRSGKAEGFPTLAAAESRALDFATDGDIWAIGQRAGFDDEGWMQLSIIELVYDGEIYIPRNEKNRRND